MKTESVIIDIRHQIPWQKRYLSNTGTLMLWFFWLLLWQPIAMSLGLIEVRPQHFVNQVIDTFLAIVEHGVMVIVTCAAGLWLWSRIIPSKTVKNVNVKIMQDYAKHYELDVQSIHRARQKKIVTVYYDETGNIQHIE